MPSDDYNRILRNKALIADISYPLTFDKGCLRAFDDLFKALSSCKPSLTFHFHFLLVHLPIMQITMFNEPNWFKCI